MIAVDELSMLEIITIPCSVKAYGKVLAHHLHLFVVTICDLRSLASEVVIFGIANFDSKTPSSETLPWNTWLEIIDVYSSSVR